jgi:hypothetical protein
LSQADGKLREIERATFETISRRARDLLNDYNTHYESMKALETFLKIRSSPYAVYG